MLDNYDFCVHQLSHLDKEDLHPSRLLTGHDLIKIGLPPGKVMGEILRALEDAQLEGAITSREQAEMFFRDNWPHGDEPRGKY